MPAVKNDQPYSENSMLVLHYLHSCGESGADRNTLIQELSMNESDFYEALSPLLEDQLVTMHDEDNVRFSITLEGVEYIILVEPLLDSIKK